jgi:hypothetical protein
MPTKKFSQELNERNDPRGKEWAISFMSKMGCKFERNNSGEQDGTFSEGIWDQSYINKEGHRILVEIEVREDNAPSGRKVFGEFGKDYPFRFTEYNVPGRKDPEKKNISDIFISFSPDGKYVFCVKRNVLKDCKKEKTFNKYVKGEPMYKVAHEKGHWFERIGDDWARYKKGLK